MMAVGAVTITIYNMIVVLLEGHRTCDLQVTGLNPDWAPCVVALGKLLTPVSPSSIIWYRPRGVISLALHSE